VEIPNPIPFDEDRVHASYDAERVDTFWRILQSVDGVFQRFRSGFVGKVSPVHFFWGSFDLAVTRFSGRRAPERPGADRITREAYSDEVSSAGFWAGGATAAEPFFYSYVYPEAAGYRTARIKHGRFDENYGEFVLPYDEVRANDDPDGMLLDFFQSSYDAAADLAKWDRTALEREPVAP